MSEAEIISGLKLGDEKIFRVFVENYRQLVVNTCYGLLHNVEDAEDVAQDVFIEVYRSVNKFRADAKLSTWLYRISVNRSLNYIRDNKKHIWFRSSAGEVKSKMKELIQLAADEKDHPDFEIENRQRAFLLHNSIDSLPDNQKVAFTLNKYEELSCKEISEVMNLSVSSVESLIHRAKKNLQKKLFKYYKKEGF